MFIAVGIGHAATYVKKLARYMHVLSVIRGIFLIALGILLLADNLGVWLSYAFKLFSLINYEKIYEFL